MKDYQYQETANPLMIAPPEKGNSNAPTVNGFPRVVVDGSFVRVDQSKPFYERMVSKCPALSTGTHTDSNTKHTLAVLESVTCNLEAGVEMLNLQENSLAKIGGRLADIALSLNKAKALQSSSEDLRVSQIKFDESRDKIREIAKSTYKHVALFSNGPAAPIAIAVPVLSSWEGLSIQRADISSPGLKTVDSGKIHGDQKGYYLDHGSIKRAFDEWKTLCINNRLQWGLLRDNIHRLKKSASQLHSGGKWRIPLPPSSQGNGRLNRPHKNN